jgi:hypothetical protein
MPTRSRSATLSRREVWLVEQLSHTPDTPSDLRVEIGILGPSKRKGYCRLYRGPDPRDFLEIRESDIRHRRSLESESKPLSGTILWLSNDAHVRNVRSEQPRSQAEFLQGALINTFLPGTGVGGVSPGGSGIAEIWTAFTSEPCAVITIGILIYTAIEECGTHGPEDDDDDDDDDDGEAD